MNVYIQVLTPFVRGTSTVVFLPFIRYTCSDLCNLIIAPKIIILKFPSSSYIYM